MLELFPLTPFNDVLIIKPKVHKDSRGYFFESYNAKSFESVMGRKYDFVQDNHSRSSRGTLRGIHYQLPPHAQGKLVRVTNGAVFDVAVDLRRSSPTFGRWGGYELRAANKEMVWIPPGFGHALLVLEDDTDFLYKTTDFYAPECEASIAWDDPEIRIEWPKCIAKNEIKLSEKDRQAKNIGNAMLFG